MSDPDLDLRPTKHHSPTTGIPNSLFKPTSRTNPYPQAYELKRQVGIIRPPPIAKQPRSMPIGLLARKQLKRVNVHGAFIMGTIPGPRVASTHIVTALGLCHALLSRGQRETRATDHTPRQHGTVAMAFMFHRGTRVAYG
jgi:hypothetical protein